MALTYQIRKGILRVSHTETGKLVFETKALKDAPAVRALVKTEIDSLPCWDFKRWGMIERWFRDRPETFAAIWKTIGKYHYLS